MKGFMVDVLKSNMYVRIKIILNNANAIYKSKLKEERPKTNKYFILINTNADFPIL